jgi:SAM-dependent methyltransferase
MHAKEALDKLLSEFLFTTVLDVGCGTCEHSYAFHKAEKKVTAIDLKAPSCTPFRTIGANYMDYEMGEFYHCIWLSHVLEHQLNVQSFLRKIYYDLISGGILAITVPPMKPEIVGGHVSLWNMGLLIYRLVLAGFDCREAIGKTYGYNISVIVRKRRTYVDLEDLNFDTGDIGKLAEFFPRDMHWPEGFNGNIDNIDWN